MKYLSTRGQAREASLSEAIALGLAEDGGLYVPSQFPLFERGDFARVETLPEVARILLEPFCKGDTLAGQIGEICSEAFSFPIPLRPLSGKSETSVLELFHGPTAAFKDVGARFLAACLERTAPGSESPLTILVATSGDTGGAVAAAFHRRDGIEVEVLYPAGLVSPRQEKQLTCWGDNVRAWRVDGVFDDCQRLVKQAFAAPQLADKRLSSANSISIGRLLPQTVYYAAASLWHWRERGQLASFVVPTGNLGNAVAATWARKMGLPIGRIVMATNANRVIPDFLASGDWQPRQSVATLASAMDVGHPSNMERLRHLYPDFDALAAAISAWAVSDEQIAAQIAADFRDHNELWCPHTATGHFVRDHYLDDTEHFIVVATAHPAKFETVIEPIIGATVDVPPALESLLDLPSSYIQIDADFATFAKQLQMR